MPEIFATQPSGDRLPFKIAKCPCLYIGLFHWRITCCSVRGESGISLVVSIWAGTNGKLDEVAVEDILRFESELHDYLARNTKVLDTLRDTNVLDDDTTAALDAAIDKFKLEFQTGDGRSLISVGTEVFEEIAEEDIEQEKIVKQKRGK